MTNGLEYSGGLAVLNRNALHAVTYEHVSELVYGREKIVCCALFFGAFFLVVYAFHKSGLNEKNYVTGWLSWLREGIICTRAYR